MVIEMTRIILRSSMTEQKISRVRVAKKEEEDLYPRIMVKLLDKFYIYAYSYYLTNCM